MNELGEIIQFFDALVISQTGIFSLDSGYFYFMKNLGDINSYDEFFEKLYMPKTLIDSFLKEFSNKQIYDSLWIPQYGTSYDRKDTVSQMLAPNYLGNYFLLYNIIAQQDSIFNEYTEKVMVSGAIPPSIRLGFQTIYDKIDFSNEVIRLGVAIHYLIVISYTEITKVNPPLTK